MSDILNIIHEFQKDCPCGHKHSTTVEDVVIESGAAFRVGEILQKNNFSNHILLVADQNTLKAAEGIQSSKETESSQSFKNGKSQACQAREDPWQVIQH